MLGKAISSRMGAKDLTVRREEDLIAPFRGALAMDGGSFGAIMDLGLGMMSWQALNTGVYVCSLKFKQTASLVKKSIPAGARQNSRCR